MIPKLPDELIIEILARLPVRSLLRFKCVSKSWLSLISSQQFVKTHLFNSKKDPNFTHHGVILTCEGKLEQSSIPSLLSNDAVFDVLDSEFAYGSGTNLAEVVGSCDGLILLSCNDKDLFLFNPSTRIHKKLPRFGEKIKRGRRCSHGLGFDKSSGDYKVVGLYYTDKDLSEVTVKVYSSKNDRWKSDRWKTKTTVNHSNVRRVRGELGAFAHGKLHWICHSSSGRESEWSVVYLDLETEEYGELQMPNYEENELKCGGPVFGASEGNLFVLVVYPSSADMWIMVGGYEGSGNESWTKVVTLPYDGGLVYPPYVDGSVELPYVDDFSAYANRAPLYMLLLWCSSIVVFDGKGFTARSRQIRTDSRYYRADTYLESLVSPLG
ncbi:hypothetical protein ACP275_07G006500 [Erythranthe tilingii]